MSVYAKERPDYLKTAMNSMWSQTLPTDDFVLVCDGDLNDELEALIADMGRDHADCLTILRTGANRGLGYALALGLRHCRRSLVARMDSDDYSVPQRCEKQLEYFRRDPRLSIVGSNVVEFDRDIRELRKARIVPETNAEIYAFSKRRNPFNHPSVMFRKEHALKVGGYKDIRNIQDYFLWVDMLSAGYRGYNIQEPLVYMRADDGQYRRRSGGRYLSYQIKLLNYMRKKKYISGGQYMASAVVRTASSLAPNTARRAFFAAFLRK